MPRKHDNLSETHTADGSAGVIRVRAEDCPALAQHHIAHVGERDVAVPFRIVRSDLSGAFLLGTFGGEGRMLVDGRWLRHRPGMMSLAPAHALHSFHAVASHRWQYCWVRYMPTAPRFAAWAAAPRMATFDPKPLRYAIMGLHHEIQMSADAGSLVLWVDLIERYVSRFSEPWHREERLHAVWAEVHRDLARDWSVPDLAKIACMSDEHLRRLCQRSLGRSPIQQLTYLRVQHAAHLIASSEEKIETIAQSVGYENPFAFSNTFKRMTGFRPSDYRACKRVL